MTQRKAKLRDLYIVTMIADVSDRFGVPPTADDECTASGFPLSDDPLSGVRAAYWTDTMAEQFNWLAQSTAKIEEERARTICALIRAAFAGDERAVAALRKVA